MKAKRLLALPIAAFAMVPLTALADGGDAEAGKWLDSLHSARSVQEVRAEARQLPLRTGDLHPVELSDWSEGTRTRAEVRAELAQYGAHNEGA
jgi:hypothetical protein